MMAADSFTADSIDADADRETETTPPKKSRRSKRSNTSQNANDDTENGPEPVPKPSSTRKGKHFATTKVDESTLQASISDERPQEIAERAPARSPQPRTTIEEPPQRARAYEEIELTTVSDVDDDDDDDDEEVSKQDTRPTSLAVADHDTMVSSFTTTNGDNDVIEIHEFTSADTDAYLDIYFDTLHNRLAHLVGTGDQLQQFRLAMKTRINTKSDSREYQNVLLGKMSGEVVAAVLLAFPNEPDTIANSDVLAQPGSCWTSVRRRMARYANYSPTNGNECYIEMIGVRDGFRSHGIGAAMVECAEHFARQAGARLLTLHVNSERLRDYFDRFNFALDHSDSSAFWKWLVERESVLKMAKTLAPVGDHDAADQLDNYIDESMAEGDDV